MTLAYCGSCLEPRMSLGRSCLLSDKCLHRLNKQDRMRVTKLSQKLVVWFCDLSVAAAKPFPFLVQTKDAKQLLVPGTCLPKKKNDLRMCLVFAECRTCRLNKMWRTQTCAILFFRPSSFNVWCKNLLVWLPTNIVRSTKGWDHWSAASWWHSLTLGHYFIW